MADASHNFTFCLNASTIRGQKLGIIKELEIAAEAGYQGVEIWVESLRDFIARGGKASEVRTKAESLGLKIEGAIGFSRWIAEDKTQRIQGLQQAAEEMQMLADAGCHRLAAPPAGATSDLQLNLDDAAERYRALLEKGTEYGVVPVLELWGFSKNLSKLSEVLYVAAGAGHANACILADVYHLYKGDNREESLQLIEGKVMPVFHMNDYPAMPDRTQIADKDRIMPGDGVAPIEKIIHILHKKNAPVALSLELFSDVYWKKDPLEVAREGLSKMKALVQKAVMN
ncbi:MAG: sugar phosphate isomerase/epimerase [Cyclobacteriaceae bacterium]|nr:sugar phosphate isomerase/epimerase [Cyclobacteriaceae bacterium]